MHDLEISPAKRKEIISSLKAEDYSQGSLDENAKLIQLADDPHEFKKLLNYCTTLDQKFIEKRYRTIDNLLEEQKKSKFEKQLENYFFGTCIPNNLTGFKTPDFRKFSEMVVFFTEKLEPWKTKLNKLLFYADFIMHKQSGFSMSCVQYRAIPMGPVPINFNSIFEYLANKDNQGANPCCQYRTNNAPFRCAFPLILFERLAVNFTQGQNRDKLTLFPTTLDSAVDQGNEVRQIDIFVNSLDSLKMSQAYCY